MEPTLAGQLAQDPSLSRFVPDEARPEMSYVGLRCRCDGTRFRVIGWPRVATAGGSFFWRSLARVWREARATTEEGEPSESPFWLPLFVRCEGCGLESTLLDGDAVAGALPVERRGEPRESYRCRVCRRGVVELVVGEAHDARRPERADYEVLVCCSRCTRQARVAWSEGRPSAREVRLDLLYGRR